MRKSEPVLPKDVFGRLTVVGQVFRKGKSLYAPVVCVCGKTKAVEQTTLRRGLSRSCGCLSAEMTGARSTTHRKRGAPVYAVWNAMVQRCHSPKNKQYADYGGRGIFVCRKWRKFESFYVDMGDPPFSGAALDRVNNGKGYSKSNCRWVTQAANNLNRRNSLNYLYLGQVRALTEIANLCGVKYSTLYQRLHRYKWPFAKAVQSNPL